MTATQPALAPHPTPQHPARVFSPAASPASQPQPQLEELGRAVERHAGYRGAEVEFLGVEPLFDQPRIYGEGSSPWVICPAAADPLIQAGIPIPAAQQRRLDAILKAGMDFPHLYLAHEVAGGHSHKRERSSFEHYRALSDQETKRLVVRPDAPAATRKAAKRVDRMARGVGRGIGLAATGAAMALAAPLALLADGLDPAVLGALTLPGTGHKAGTPAAWFLLARWDW